MDSNITSAIISSIIAIIGVAVSIILARNQIKASDLQFDKQREFDKNNEIRRKVADYLAEITRAYDILKSFLENRKHLEIDHNQISQIIQNGGDLDYVLGGDPRDEMQGLSDILNTLHADWKLKIKEVEENSQELLLYFDSLESRKIEKLILYAPENLSRYNWVFTTNFPEELLRTTFDSLCGDISVPKNVEEIRTEMRKILN